MGRPLLFALNGQRVELAEVDPRTTVLQYIRSETSLKGTKLGCGEGGCGACTVVLSRYDPQTKRVEESTINSCLALLCSIDGCAITTTEGLKTSKNELHAVHKRIGGFHASQCGFCTPGMSMSMYAGLRKASCTLGGQPGGCQSNGQSHGSVPGLKALDAAKFISGNICRCTGYRPLVDTCKSFAGDVDVEDLGINAFWSSKQHAHASLLPPYNPEEDPKFPSFLIDEIESRVANAEHRASGEIGLSFKHVTGGESPAQRLWLTAGTLSEAFDFLDRYNTNDLEVKLVVGNTSSGVYKDIKPQVYIDISGIPELQTMNVTDESVHVGAGVSLSKLIELLEGEKNNVVYSELTKHLKQIASQHVRNRASLGGNLILAQKFGFDSDLATILLGAGTQVTLASAKGQSSTSLEEFLSQGGLETGTLLVSISIPSWIAPQKGSGVGQLFFRTYRVSVRPNGNAVSYVNAAMLAVVDRSPSELVVKDLRLAFGAFGGPHAIRARKTEKLLIGKSVSPAGLLEAVELLKEEIKPPPTVHKSTYRGSVAVAFFFDFFNSYIRCLGKTEDIFPDAEDETEDANIPVENVTENGATDGISGEIALSNGTADSTEDVREDVSFGTTDLKVRNKKPMFSSSQTFSTSKEFWPVAEPTKKYAAELQASGEVVYVDDIPVVKDTLYATFVLNDQQPGKLLSVDASEALKSPGSVNFFTAKDVPGKNSAFSFFFLQDRLFAEDTVDCVNDLLGVLVADSYENAKEAASKVKANVEPVGDPIYTIEEAIAKESYGELGFWAFAAQFSTGEFPVKADHRIENGEVSSGSQYHFFMETQCAYAIPEEDSCITVYSANQNPNAVQQAVAASLGIPMHSVRIITRRLGGAFGGKFTRACQVAVACAIAAFKLKRPVKMFLDRQTDMRMGAGRHETKAIYSVDFNADGRVKGLEIEVFIDGGRAKDMSPIILLGLGNSMRQYDWGSMKSIAKVCKTNKVSRTIMRGPGDTQGHFIAETIIEHVAAYLGMDAYKVRQRNMHSVESLNKFFPNSTNSEISNTLPHLWPRLMESSQFEKRKLAVQRFNDKSKWVKKGIDMVVGLYETGTMAREARVSIFEDGSVVVEVGGIEMGQGLWTKVKQAVAYGLSKLWGPEAHPMEKVDMSKIRIVQNDTISLVNSEPTGGSTGSEASCQAALMACKILVERFEPFLQQLRQSGASPAPWEAIIGMAKLQGISLSAQADFVTNQEGYVNFGVCASEVAVDVLTGSTTILQTDLVYDCGKSLNPAVDIGQVEGAFLMGVGFYMTEEWHEDRGKVISDGTWDYKPPTLDNVPKRFYVELSNTKANKDRILSSKASGEPPLLLAKSVHSAIRHAITAAREDFRKLPHYEAEKSAEDTVSKKSAYFRFDSPASIDRVQALCGLYNVEKYLASLQ